MNFFTSTLTSGSVTIATTNGVSQLTVAPRTGSSCEIIGNMTFQGNQSTAIPIAEGETFVISAASPSSPIDGFTIIWVAGGIDIMMGF
jgi:hypothetical protein